MRFILRLVWRIRLVLFDRRRAKRYNDTAAAKPTPEEMDAVKAFLRRNR